MQNERKTVEDYKRELEDCLSASLRITHDQVDKITVYSLVKRYKGLEDRVSMRCGDLEDCKKSMQSIKDVLRFYLPTDEINSVLSQE